MRYRQHSCITIIWTIPIMIHLFLNLFHSKVLVPVCWVKKDGSLKHYTNFFGTLTIAWRTLKLYLIFTRESRMLLTSLPSSVCLSVRASVTLVNCIKTVQARITKSSLWAAPRSLVYRDKILCHWVQGFSSNEGVEEGYPPKKDVILPLLVRIMWKRLQIGAYMLLIITSTGDRLFGFINIDDLEPLKKRFLVNFSQFLDAAHISTLNCDEMAGNRPRQSAYEIFSIQRRF